MSRIGQPIAATSPGRPRVTRAPRPVRSGPSYRPGEPGTLRSGDLVLDGSRWTVHRAGTPVDLSPTEFRLLACLMRHQGTVLTRTQLLRTVWGRDYAGQPQVVETYVSYLRRKLGRLGPPLIHTHRGIGYVLCPPDVQERYCEPADEHRPPRGDARGRPPVASTSPR